MRTNRAHAQSPCPRPFQKTARRYATRLRVLLRRIEDGLFVANAVNTNQSAARQQREIIELCHERGYKLDYSSWDSDHDGSITGTIGATIALVTIPR